MAAGSVRRRYYVRHIARYTQKNNLLIALGGLFVAGMALGVFMLGGAGDETISLFESLVGGVITRRAEANLSDNFIAAFGSSMLFVSAVFVMGFCAIAGPAIFAVPFVRGLGFGFSAALLYLRYGASAAGTVGILMLPGMLISTLAILLCCRQALGLSAGFLTALRDTEIKTAQHPSLRGYCLSFALLTGLCAISAFIEAALYLAFANSLVLG